MQLSKLTRDLALVRREGPDADPEITRVTSDSREVGRGALFVAITGGTHDGHHFVREAVQRGAAAVVAEREVAVERIPLLYVPNSRIALAQCAAEWFGRPAEALRLIGVTGTVGKSSTTLLLSAILRGGGTPTGVIGSLGIDLGTFVHDTPNTTPEPVLLHGALAHMRQNRLQTAVMEVSSHALGQERTYGLRFDLAVITNLLPLEHSDYHRNFAEYVRTKSKLLAQLRPDGVVVYNRDDARVRAFVGGHQGLTLSYGLAPRADVRAVEISVGPDGSSFTLRLSDHACRVASSGETLTREWRVRLPLLGIHNVQNAAAAAAAAVATGVPCECIVEALAGTRPFPRRVEPSRIGHFHVIDDTAGHPKSLDRLFTCLARLECTSLLLVVSVRGARGEAVNEANAERIASWYRRLPIRRLWVTASADATSPANAASEAEALVFTRTLESRGAPFTYFESLRETCADVLAHVSPGEVVVLAGAQGLDRGAEFLREGYAGMHTST